jgi:hypothetical protein
MKFYFDSRTLATHLTLTCHFFSIMFRLPPQRLPQFYLCWPRILGSESTENTVSIVRAQQFFYCLIICCRGNLFSESLPSNERLLWLRYSGFQAACHNTVDVAFCVTIFRRILMIFQTPSVFLRRSLLCRILRNSSVPWKCSGTAPDLYSDGSNFVWDTCYPDRSFPLFCSVSLN